MITKKDLPFDLLNAIEPIAQANLDLIVFQKEQNTYYSFIETDSRASSFFKILIDGSKRLGNYDKSKYTFELKPADKTNPRRILSQDYLSELPKHFERWVKLVRDIHETPSVHDDNFTKTYAEFYYNEFEIVDDDVHTAPFNPEQQDLIDLYLESLLETVEQSLDEGIEAEKAEILQDIREIKTSLPNSTKSQVMKAITRVFGKLFKSARSFGKEIVNEARKRLIKKLFDLGIEYGPKMLEELDKLG